MSGRLSAIEADITRLEVEAIVNAANTALFGAGALIAYEAELAQSMRVGP